jgi:hypothetical protein
MQTTRIRLCIAVGAIAVGALASFAHANAAIRGAYYRLGDADPGATPGVIGNDPTVDSFSDALHLSRFGLPRYSSFVPPLGPFDTKLSMAFANGGLGGPAFPGFYGRTTAIPIIEQGMALEAWVNIPDPRLRGPSPAPSPDPRLIAYDGNPAADGFGLFQNGDSYVARVGTFERTLGPAEIGVWHHLAYVNSLGTASYFYDGRLVAESKTDPVPTAPTSGFWIGGQSTGLNDEGQFLFNGWVDEVRYQSFNPLSASGAALDAFLITVPEPAGGCSLVCALALLLTTRRRAAGRGGYGAAGL